VGMPICVMALWLLSILTQVIKEYMRNGCSG
jgi:hypothetical protein